MLEIDVDIGRLAAFAGDEALEEQLVLDGVDAGDAEHEADAAVRRRSAPLTQDAPPAAFGDDAVHRQEIGRVAELADQPQLVRDLVAIGLRQALGEHPRRGGCGQLFERALRGQPLDHPLVRILVAEFAKVEGAGACDRGGGGDRIWEGGKAPLHLGGGFEVPVGMALAPVAERVDRAFLADRGDDVLQQPRVRSMVEDVAERHRADARLPGERGKVVKAERIIGPAAEGEAAIAARAEGRAQFGETRRSHRIRLARQQDRDKPLVPSDDVAPAKRAAALAGARLAQRQQPGQPRPGGLVGRVEQQRAAVIEVDPRPRDHPHARRLLRLPGAHQPGDAAAIDDAERAMALQGGGGEQLVGAGGAAQEREMARHLKLDIGGGGARHQPNSPWRYQLRSPVAGSTPSPRRNSQKRAPRSSSTQK